MKPDTRHTAVVGAGIVGLAHAWAAASTGDRVTVFERADKARGASVRNFGMFLPLGQAPEHYQLALRGREYWNEFASAMKTTARPCGSLCVADRDDEAAVLEEFASIAPGLGYQCSLWTRGSAEAGCPGLRRGVAKAALFSPTECNIDPRESLAKLPVFLSGRYDVGFQWNTHVAEVSTGRLATSAGDAHSFDRIFICSGNDLASLFPEVLAASPLRTCKLQMMRTVPQPGSWSMGPMLSSGLSLRHYPPFALCKSLTALRGRIARETPELDLHGIHVMASQDKNGGVVLGDSHEYGADIEAFDKAEIDALILREARRVFDFPTWEIAERWHGLYVKHPGGPMFRAEPLPGVHIATGAGGSGMTLAFALAECFVMDHIVFN